MLNVTISGDRSVVTRLQAIPDKVHDALVKKIRALALELEARVKRKLSGEVLNVKTGALRRSIFNEISSTSTGVTAKVASSGDVKYAAIHEFGGKTPAHDIFPVKAKALAFMAGGHMVFAKSVHHPGSTIPERSYMRTSLAEMREEISGGIKDAVREGIKGAVLVALTGGASEASVRAQFGGK